MDTHIPKVFLTSNIQLEDVRNYLLDNGTDTNVLGATYYFSDDEIIDAMKRTVDAYNAIPPLSIRMTYGKVYGNTMLLAGIGYQLCLSKMRALSAKDVDYNSGGTSTNLVSKQLQHLAQMKNEFKQEFMELAMAQKKSINIHKAFASF